MKKILYLNFALKTIKRAVITFRNKFLYFLNIVFKSPKSGADLKTVKTNRYKYVPKFMAAKVFFLKHFFGDF
jgi:hypothetical protein